MALPVIFQRKTQFNNLLNQVYHAFDIGEFVISIFLDLTKVFDLENRSYLLRKLYLYGVQDIKK